MTDHAQLLQILQSVTPSSCLLIPTCRGAAVADSWQPGVLSFQLVLSGQIPTTPWDAESEAVVKRGGLICVEVGGASTRRYDVARKHLSFHVRDGQVLVQLFERQANEDPGRGSRGSWEFPASSALIELTQLISKGFRENVPEACIQQWALSMPEMLTHYLTHKPSSLLIRGQQWLREHAGQDLNRHDLAAYLHCHPDHITRLFRQAGSSFADERKRLRCERVCEFLADQQLSLGEIAAVCGFNSETYLIRSFKQIYGCTPGEWRRRQSIAD